MKRKGRDPNDILREDGVDALREAFDSAKPFEPDNGPNKYVHNGNGGDTNQQQAERNSDRAQNKQAESSLGLPLTYFDDLSEKPTPKPWVIKNVIARDERRVGLPRRGEANRRCSRTSLFTSLRAWNGAAIAPKDVPASSISRWNAPTSCGVG
jgi:hypothetical protein